MATKSIRIAGRGTSAVRAGLWTYKCVCHNTGDFAERDRATEAINLIPTARAMYREFLHENLQ
ncbi:MAG: hypothetical protein WC322_06215 [Candidatus Paceibacterota bacterium]